MFKLPTWNDFDFLPLSSYFELAYTKHEEYFDDNCRTIMFKFNFGNESEIPDEKDLKENDINWYKCREVEITSELLEKLKDITENEIINLKYEGAINLKCLSSSHVIDKLKKQEEIASSDVIKAEKNHSDLIPGKYEGGLKIWECTEDLVGYLSKTDVSFDGKNILDLGCGVGILGILALLKGGSVTFQDYNKEVLELITIPNVFLNIENTNTYDKTKFFSGDWDSFLNVLLNNWGDVSEKECEPTLKKQKHVLTDKFDYILSSETIYNSFNYVKIYNIIKDLMKFEGVCYIAAKKCYFGVGGSTQGFADFLKRDNIFDVETCWFSNKGVAREILKITFRKQS